MRFGSRTALGLLCASLTTAPVGAQEPAAATADEAAAAAAADEAAQSAPPAGAGPEETEAGGASEAELEAYWSRRLANAQARIQVAVERAEQAEAEYSRARHDHNPRGAALEELREKHEAAQQEVLDAQAALPRLVEQARRAGAPPGVLADYWQD